MVHKIHSSVRYVFNTYFVLNKLLLKVGLEIIAFYFIDLC